MTAPDFHSVPSSTAASSSSSVPAPVAGPGSPIVTKTRQKQKSNASTNTNTETPSSPRHSAPSKRPNLQSIGVAESTGDLVEMDADDLPVKMPSSNSTLVDGVDGSTEMDIHDKGLQRQGGDIRDTEKMIETKESSGSIEKQQRNGARDGTATDDSALQHRKSKKAKTTNAKDHYPPLRDGVNGGQAFQQREHAYQAGGIRFAPWNIPYRRRLQTVAVMIHCLSIASTVAFFFFLCAIPIFWPILIPYLLHMLLSKSSTNGKLRMRSERWRRLPIWKLFGEYFPAKLHKTHDLPATRKYIFGYHPHGIISHGAFAAFGTEALGFSEKFPGITNSLLTLDSNFRIPLYRDYILAFGLQSVSKESITNILSTGGRNNEGMGRAVTIVVGGARESLEATPGTMNLVLADRKGFVKMAIRTGADLVPVLAFGENDLYDQVSPKSHPNLHKLQMWVLRTAKFTMPFLHGRGIFNYDVGLMPYRRPLNIVVGRPIKVMQRAEGDIEAAEVDRLHEEYVEELKGIWEAYNGTFTDGKVELQILK
ncbi:putative diacylglycerol O-acyltransferase 2A [Podospora australis]|uniref:diacylglycerol O-acyltransferase n=1 Tax=Podospora australis TaxID=1536484 RepID=A0AAN6WXE4_9PEZI|nr:putative diacylglycerol O-acyltransferase 2A [Podospora australis]